MIFGIDLTGGSTRPGSTRYERQYKDNIENIDFIPQETFQQRIYGSQQEDREVDESCPQLQSSQ